MLILAEFELSRQALIDSINVSHLEYPGGVTIATGKSGAEFTLPAISPTLAYRYRGFECNPDETGIRVAMLKEGVRYHFNLVSMSWLVDATDALWNSPDEFRAGLLVWSEPVQIRISLSLLSNNFESVYPRITGITLGYDVTDSVVEYTMEFALPEFLSVPIEFTRRVDPIDGVTFPYPSSFDASRMTNPKMIVPGRTVAPATIGYNPTTDVAGILVVSTPITAQMHRLVFDYSPQVSRLQRELFEVSDVPSITIRQMEVINLRRIDASLTASKDLTSSVGWSSTYLGDIPVEVVLIGEIEDDCWRMVQAITQRIASIGYIDLPAFAMQMPVSMHGNPKVVMNSEKNITGSLYAHSFRILFRNVPIGESEFIPSTLVNPILNFTVAPTNYF